MCNENSEPSLPARVVGETHDGIFFRTPRQSMKRKSIRKTSPSPHRTPVARSRSSVRPRATRSPSRPGPPLTDDLLSRLHRNILFTNVSDESFSSIAPKLIVRRLTPGEVVFDESTRGRDLYLIAQGRISIKKYTKYGSESLLAVLHEGDFFGELSIIDGLPRSARAEASDHAVIASFSAADFRTLIKDSDAFTFNLLNNLAIRLRTMDQTFVRELERNAQASRAKMEKLNLLIEASKTVNSTIDIDRLLVIILDAAAQSIKADRGTLYLIDEANQELWSKAAQGKDMVEIRLPIGKGLAGYVAKTGETVNIADAYRDPRFNPEIDRKSGYKTHNVLCMPMRDKEGKIVGVFQLLNKQKGSFTEEDASFIDGLSVHAAIAVENARLAREMVKNERLSAVGRMASSIIHDIKNPMGTLRLYAQVIQKKSGGTELARMAEEIIRQVDRFVKMTQEILDFSRGVSEMNAKPVRLEEVMEGALKFLEADFERKKVRLERRYEFTDRCVLDIEKMIRVMYNLAGNAVDAMPTGGTLTVRTRNVDSSIYIEFTDTGVGMLPEIRARVFEPFFTHGKKRGTGLGLAIVKKIMDDHKGKIEIDSTPNAGTTFRLIFPRGI
jgi:nitrogen-specific signal transduction histidine kinase/CRP-like cAMP-binding protein